VKHQRIALAFCFMSLSACHSNSQPPLASNNPGANNPGQNGTPPTTDPGAGTGGNGAGAGTGTGSDGAGVGPADAAAALADSGSPTDASGGSDASSGGLAPSPFIDTAAAIHAFMTFDYRVTAAQIAGIASHIDFVWGADTNKLAAWRSGNPKAYLTWYIPFNQDPGNQPLSWWQANHPDWVLYQCDKTTPATASGYPNVDLDISNPAVRAYQLDLIKTAAAKGYDGVAFDLYAIDNAHHGCGVYRNGQWVQLYTGNWTDPAFAKAALDWLTAISSAMHALPKPMGVVPNYSLARSADDATSQTILANVDAILDEDTTANWGSYITGNTWLQRISWMQKLQAAGKAYYAISGFSGPLSNADMQYSLASYLMGKEHHAALFVYDKTTISYGADPWRAEYAAAVGAACGEMTPMGSAYARTFTNGLSLVNPSGSASTTVTLPAGRAYKDLAGNAVSGSVTLAPHGGLVLISATPGC
jgi:hypothetical protein